MSLAFTMGTGGLPVGTYPAEFSHVEPFENEFGPAVLLTFTVTNGEEVGNTATRIVSQKLSPKSNLHKFVKAFKGSTIEPGERIELERFVGTRGMIITEETDSGSTRVASFLKS